MNPYVKALPIIVFSVLLNAFAQIAMKKAVSAVGMAWAPGPLVRLFLHPWMLVCLGCYAVSVVVWAAAMSHVPVNYAYPFLALGFVAGAFMSQALLGETIPPMRWLAIGVIVAGVVLLAFTGGRRRVRPRPPDRQPPREQLGLPRQVECGPELDRRFLGRVEACGGLGGDERPADLRLPENPLRRFQRLRRSPGPPGGAQRLVGRQQGFRSPAPQGEGPRLDGFRLGPERLRAFGMAARAAGVHVEQRAFHAVADDPRRALGPDRHVAVHAGDAAPGVLALEPQFVGGAPDLEERHAAQGVGPAGAARPFGRGHEAGRRKREFGLFVRALQPGTVALGADVGPLLRRVDALRTQGLQESGLGWPQAHRPGVVADLAAHRMAGRSGPGFGSAAQGLAVKEGPGLPPCARGHPPLGASRPVAHVHEGRLAGLPPAVVFPGKTPAPGCRIRVPGPGEGSRSAAAGVQGRQDEDRRDGAPGGPGPAH